MTTRIAVVLPLVIFATFSSSAAGSGRHVSNRELHAEKHGRVVDADTGTGIPGAKVIALWKESSSGVPDAVSGGEWCQLQKITTTDAGGNFSLPDVSKDLDLSARGSHVGLSSLGPATYAHDNTWRLIVFKPGYVRTGADVAYSGPYASDQTNDDRKVLQHLMAGNTDGCKAHYDGCMNRFLWAENPPATEGATIKPIAMKKAGFSAPQAWLYYAAIQGTGQCMDRMAKPANAPEFSEVTNAIRGIVSPLLSGVCSMPRDMEISRPVLDSFTSWVRDDDVVRRIVKAVGQREWGTKETTAGVLCDAISAKKTAP